MSNRKPLLRLLGNMERGMSSSKPCSLERKSTHRERNRTHDVLLAACRQKMTLQTKETVRIWKFKHKSVDGNVGNDSNSDSALGLQEYAFRKDGNLSEFVDVPRLCDLDCLPRASDWL